MEQAAPLGSGPAIDAAGIFLVSATVFVFLLPLFYFFPPVPPSQTDAILQTHSRIGLDKLESNLPGSKIKKRKAASGKENGASSSPGSLPKVRSLWIYPIKSCKGIEVKEAKILPQGLEFDRIFTLAQLKSPFPVSLGTPKDEQRQHQWDFITQRQFPLLATVKVDLYVPDVVKCKRQSVRTDEVFLVIRFPWRERGLKGVWEWFTTKLAKGRHAVPEMEVVIGASFPSKEEIEEKGYVFEDVTIWRNPVRALNMEAELPNELRLYLGVSNKLGLFRFDPETMREVSGCPPTIEDAGYKPNIHFQDAYPLHLLGLASVNAFDEKVPKDADLQELDPRRFRPNIIVDGAPAYDEDSWKLIRLKPTASSKRDEFTLHVSCRTTRCKLPNTDPGTGFKHPLEPDKSLRAHREIDEGAKHKGCFGMQLTPLFDKSSRPEDMMSWIEVGMSIDVLERGSHFYK